MSKKKAPKRSKDSKSSDLFEIVGLFVLLILLIVVSVFFTSSQNQQEDEEDIVAIINDEILTLSDFEWWYHISIQGDGVSKQEFLESSLIPQTLLRQKAEQEGIEISEEEIDTAIGLYVIDRGIDVDDFSAELEKRNLDLDDIRKSFETRLLILRLLEQEQLEFELLNSQQSIVFQDYLADLENEATIELFLETIALAGLEEISDCAHEESVAYLFVTSTCEGCEESRNIFNRVVDQQPDITAFVWELDTGDDLRTAETESFVPKDAVSIFKKQNEKLSVPTLVLGCDAKLASQLEGEHSNQIQEIIEGW